MSQTSFSLTARHRRFVILDEILNSVIAVISLFGVSASSFAIYRRLRPANGKDVMFDQIQATSNEELIDPYLKYESLNHYEEGQYRP